MLSELTLSKFVPERCITFPLFFRTRTRTRISSTSTAALSTNGRGGAANLANVTNTSTPHPQPLSPKRGEGSRYLKARRVLGRQSGVRRGRAPVGQEPFSPTSHPRALRRFTMRELPPKKLKEDQHNMKPTTVYALNCAIEEESKVVTSINTSLGKIKRTTSRATQKTLLDSMKPFVHKHYFWNLNRDCGVYFEVLANQDMKGKLHLPRSPEAGLVLMFVLADNGYRDGKPMKKTLQYVERILKCLPVPYELVGEGEDREIVERELLQV